MKAGKYHIRQQKKTLPKDGHGKAIAAASVKPEKVKWLVISAILALTAAVYYPVLTCDFTNWDDPKYLVDNILVKNLSLENIKKIFLFDQPKHSYVPLSQVSFAIEYHFFGLNPMIYHLDNLLLHLLNTLLVFLFFYKIIPSSSNTLIIASATSLLFAIHPMHVESVAWITERKDMLYTFFYLLTLIYYVKYINKNIQFANFLIALLFFTLSCMSKGMAVTLAPVLFVVDYLLGRKFSWKVILEKAPFFLIAFSYVLITLATVKAVSVDEHKIGNTVFLTFDSVFYAFYGIMQYLYKLALPINQSCFYPHPEKIDGMLQPIFYIAPFIVTIIAGAVFFSAKKTRIIVFGSMFFLCTIAIVLQLMPVGDNIITERYTYIPYIGFFFIAGNGIARLLTVFRFKSYRTLSIVALAAVFVTLAVMCNRRARVWENSFTLWSDVIEKFPKEHTSYNNRGIYLLDEDRLDEALADFDKSIALKNDYYDAYLNRGNVYRRRAVYDKALENYNVVVNGQPFDPQAYNNRGNVYFNIGEYDLAMQDYNKSIELFPEHDKGYGNRGAIYAKKGQHDLAIKDFNYALRLNPDYADAYLNRAVIYSMTDQLQPAKDDYDRYLTMVQNNAIVWNWRGTILQKMGKHREAINDFTQALQLNPQAAVFYHSRSVSWQALGNTQNANQDAAKAKEFGWSE